MEERGDPNELGLDVAGGVEATSPSAKPLSAPLPEVGTEQA